MLRELDILSHFDPVISSEILAARTFSNRNQGPTRLAIELAVERVFGVQRQIIAQQNRGRAASAQARQVAMYLAHVGCGMTLTEAGRLFGRDRTTVAHACMVVEDKRDDPIWDQMLDLLERAVPLIAARPGAHSQT